MKENSPNPKKKVINSEEKQIIQLKSKISKMTYEECLNQLDEILQRAITSFRLKLYQYDS